MNTKTEPKASIRKTVKILKCGCNNGGAGTQYQDEVYGKGNRVHNPCPKANTTMYRCTCCGKERTGAMNHE